MHHLARSRLGGALLIVGVTATAVGAQNPSANCKSIHAAMVEQRTTDGCRPGHNACFLGEVTGNHGLRGTTYFSSDARGEPPPGTPDFIPYSGFFEYQTDNGTLFLRETGLTNRSQGNIESGAVLAFQKITGATGDLEGATGYFVVHGFNRGGRVETTLTGELCRP